MGDENKDGQISMKDISDAMKFLVDRMGEMGKVIQGQGETIAVMRKHGEREAQRLEQERENDREPIEEVDVENMSNTDLIAHITGAVREEIAGPLQKAIQTVGQRSEGRAIRSELQEAESNNKYFEQFRPELRAHLEANPNLSIDDAYHVVVGRNPGKMKELQDADRNKESEEATADLIERAKDFGGLTPTSGSTVANDRMSSKEAREAAWQKTMGDRESVEGALQ